MRKTAILKTDLFLEHDPGFGHPESPERLKVIYELLDKEEINRNFIFPNFDPAEEKQILAIHNEDIVERAKSTDGKTYDLLDQDTTTSKKSYKAAKLAAGAAIKGVDLLIEGKVDNCLALVRPPGHHAESDKSMGFCIFNNVAIAAQHAIDKYGLKKILILDLDVHHGNGTQHSFYESDQVLFISAHQYPFYPGTGSINENGKGKGKGYTINIPMSPGMGDVDYASVVNEIVAPIAKEFEPEIIMVSSGFDTYVNDPIGSMEVTSNGFSYLTRKIVKLAEETCDGKLFVILEGGYDMDGQREGSFAMLSELLGASVECGLNVRLEESMYNYLEIKREKSPLVTEVVEVAKKYWKM